MLIFIWLYPALSCPPQIFEEEENKQQLNRPLPGTDPQIFRKEKEDKQLEMALKTDELRDRSKEALEKIKLIKEKYPDFKKDSSLSPALYEKLKSIYNLEKFFLESYEKFQEVENTFLDWILKTGPF